MEYESGMEEGQWDSLDVLRVPRPAIDRKIGLQILYAVNCTLSSSSLFVGYSAEFRIIFSSLMPDFELST